MRGSISKTIIAGLAALALSVGVVAETTTPAAAQWHGGGWHGGGWHGGGWGWRGGGWRGGCWNCGWNNGWWGPAVVGGLALGAIATSPYWAGGGGGGCWALQPTWDGWGRYLGRRWVNVCY